MRKKTLIVSTLALTLTFLLTACAKAQQVPDEPVLTPTESPVETPVETPVEEEAPVEAPVEEPEEIKEEIVELVVTTEKVTEEVKIPFKTVKKNDETLEKGKTVVTQKGVDGIETVTYEVTMTDGVETGRKEIGRVMTKPVVDEGVKVGVKVTVSAPAPAPKPAPTTAPTPTPTPATTPKPTSTPAPAPKPVVTTKEEVVTENVAYATTDKEDPNTAAGTRIVTTTGQNGVRTIVYTVTLTDGKETGRAVKSNNVTTAPVNEVVSVGTMRTDKWVEMDKKYVPAGFTLKKEGVSDGSASIYKNGDYAGSYMGHHINIARYCTSHEERRALMTFFGKVRANRGYADETEKYLHLLDYWNPTTVTEEPNYPGITY